MDVAPDVSYELPPSSPFATGLRQAADPKVAISVSWEEIVAIAEEIRALYETTGTYETASVVRLSKAVLLFHAQLAGDLLRTVRRG